MYTFGGEKLGKGSSGGRERYVAAVGAMEKVYDVVVVVVAWSDVGNWKERDHIV